MPWTGGYSKTKRLPKDQSSVGSFGKARMFWPGEGIWRQTLEEIRWRPKSGFDAFSSFLRLL